MVNSNRLSVPHHALLDNALKVAGVRVATTLAEPLLQDIKFGAKILGQKEVVPGAGKMIFARVVPQGKGTATFLLVKIAGA